MNRIKRGLSVLCGLAPLALSVLWAYSRSATQDRPRESVTVTAVEVPVRVFDGKAFVAGFAKDDFEIYENGVRQEITGFEAVSRTISPGAGAVSGTAPGAGRRRNFVLIFNVFDYTDQVGAAIDYFFGNIFRPGDRLILIVEDKFFDPGTDRAAAELKKTLVRYKHISRWEIGKAFKDLDTFAGQVANSLSGGSSMGDPEADGEFAGIETSGDDTSDILRFYERYKLVWLDYRKRMLDIDLDLYRTVARRMQRWDGEKWAICFQQRNLFPVLKSEGRVERALDRLAVSAPMLRGAILDKKSEMRNLMDLGQSVPAAKLRALFAEANITFHLLVMKSIAPRGNDYSRDIELNDVAGDYEDALRRLSRETGGLDVFSNEAAQSLKEAAAREDRYYLLVYQSKGNAAGKDREIDVKVRRPGVEVISLKQALATGSRMIAVSGFAVKDRGIGFDVINAGRTELGGGNAGRVAVKVALFDDKGVRAFNESKTFDLIADSVHLSLKFGNLRPGDYFVVVEAADLVTGEKDVLSRFIGL